MSGERILLTNALPDAVLRALDEGLTEPHEGRPDRIVLRGGGAVIEAYAHDYERVEGVPFDELPTAVDAGCNRSPGESRHQRSNELVAEAARILTARGLRVLVVEALDRVVG